MTADVGLFSLNSGEVSRLALARADLAKMRVACETQVNFIPHVLGPAMFRPGTQFIAGVPGDAPGWLGEFYFSETEKTLLVMTAGTLMFVVNDAFVSRGAVSAVVANGEIASDLSSWTDIDEAGAASSWSAGRMMLLGTGTNFAIRQQQVTVIEPGVEHALRIVISGNRVRVAIGVSSGDITYFGATLGPGVYSIAFVPAGNFWINLASNSLVPAYVDSVTVEPAGVVALPTPYATAADLAALRYDQSGDALFVACRAPGTQGVQQRRIERRASDSRSWGIALYQSDDGPFRLGNVSSTTLTPSATAGPVTLTASRMLFRAGHVGALFRLTHSSQTKSATLGALNDATDPIRVSGLSNTTTTQRLFQILVSGTFVATITLQRSLAEPGSWVDVESYTAPVTKTLDDHLDNQIVYYRLICTAYTSGAADAALLFAGGAQTGIARITGVTNSQSAAADVLTQLGEGGATSDWAEGEWSDYRGWPAAVALHDGRLAWFPAIKAQLSVSDAYESFDDTIEGDSAPINRTIATGGLDGVRWALSLQRLLIGTAAQNVSIKSSSFDEPLTPSAFTAKGCADDGAAAGVRAVRAGTAGVFVGAASRLFKLLYGVQQQDYASAAIDRLKPEMVAAGVADLAVQRKPDNANIWALRGDGAAVLVTLNPGDDVEAMVPVVTQGVFERVAVLPGSVEDDVYFIVARTIGGVTKRFIEKLARRSEARIGALCKVVDCHVVYSSGPTTTIAGLSHLEGQQVVVWADGAPVSGVFTVSGGAIALPMVVSAAVVGLAYSGQIKTTKLAYPVEHGTGLTLQKRVSRVGLVMADVAPQAVRVGRDFAHMTGLPTTYRGRPLDVDETLESYDAVPDPFNGGWDSDSRVCLQISSPYPCTVMGLALHMETNEPIEPPPAAPHAR